MRVLKGCSLVAATAILCGVCSSFGAQTFVTLGLTNTLLGNATYGIDPYYPDWVTVGTNGDDGLSLYLGEADGAVFVYPTVYSDPSSGSFLSGKLYGSVNGETDRPICIITGSKDGDGSHPVQIDFSPLGATNVIFQVFRRGHLISQTPPQEGSMNVYGDYFTPYIPRVNPLWRMPDGSIGALIEFPGGIADTSLGSTDRIFIRPDTTNRVDFASRFDVFGGGPLGAFTIYDARLGMFGRPHKAMEAAHLHALGGRLTIANLGLGETNGVAIDFEDASRAEINFAPIELQTNGALSILGIGQDRNNQGWPLGTVRVAYDDESLTVAAQLDVAPTNGLILIYRNGAEIGRLPGTNATMPATAAVIGCTLQARTPQGLEPGIGLRLARATPILLPTGVSYEGDQILFVATNAHFLAVQTVAVNAGGIDSFTITSETSAAAEAPMLKIVRSGAYIELSWTDPNRAFALESGSCPECFFDYFAEGDFVGDNGKIVLQVFSEASYENRFFRLSSAPIPHPPD